MRELRTIGDEDCSISHDAALLQAEASFLDFSGHLVNGFDGSYVGYTSYWIMLNGKQVSIEGPFGSLLEATVAKIWDCVRCCDKVQASHWSKYSESGFDPLFNSLKDVYANRRVVELATGDEEILLDRHASGLLYYTAIDKAYQFTGRKLNQCAVAGDVLQLPFQDKSVGVIFGFGVFGGLGEVAYCSGNYSHTIWEESLKGVDDKNREGEKGKYMLQNAPLVFSECARILEDDGLVLFCNSRDRQNQYHFQSVASSYFEDVRILSGRNRYVLWCAKPIVNQIG